MIWGFAVAMLAVALIIVLFPLWRPASWFAPDSNAANVELLKVQLRELDDDLVVGHLTQAEYDAARADLKAAVAVDLVDDGVGLNPLSKKNRQWLGMILLFVVSSGSVGLYREVTTYREIAPPQHSAVQAAGQEADEQLPPMDQMIELLAAELRENPGNAEGWQMLGRSYLIMEKNEEAVGAYARAYELTGGQDPVLLTDYAEALAFASDNRMQGKPLELVNRALAIAPTMSKALWLKGFASFQEGDYAAAVNVWSKAMQNSGLTDEARQTLNAYIAEAREKIHLTDEQRGDMQAANGGREQDESVVSTSIKVQVSLDDSVSGHVDAEETVFVFARAAAGPPMPLAVRKLVVADLPTMVILDDSMAMLAGMNLSSQRQVVIGARVSRSGSPIPQAGDLQGLSEVLKPGKDVQVAVVIGETVE